jgi:uncharacterized membrane protein YphA (DoxX/SURF4 family)
MRPDSPVDYSRVGVMERNAMNIARVFFSWCPDFPSGPPGIGLLIARTTLGVAFIIQGRFCLMAAAPGSRVAGACAAVLGGLLAIGFLTPIASILGALGGLLAILSVIPDCSSPLSQSVYALFLIGVILVEILLAGPGAYSIDSRIFGRREIIIPRITSSSYDL